MDTTKEIELVKEQSNKALDIANSLVVATDDEMLEAGNVLKRVKLVGKMIKERKEEITKPMNEALKSVRALFSSVEKIQEEAQEIVSEKMLQYQKEQAEVAEKIRKENEVKLDDPATANDPHRYDDLKVVPDVMKKSEDFHTRTNKVFKVVDKTKLPMEYLIADETAIRKAMYAGILLDGVEYSEEKIIV